MTFSTPTTTHKPSFRARINAVRERLQWMTSLTHNPFAAAYIVLSVKRDQNAEQVLRRPAGPLRFRGVDELALKEVLADKEYDFLASQLAPLSRPTILDVGAHIGTFAEWALQVAPEAQILSVEADPDTYSLTAKNAASRRDSGHAWETLHAAAGSSDGETVRLLSDGPSMSHRIAEQGGVEVSTVSLCTLLDRLAGPGNQVDLMKVDIEGSEEAFLRDAGPALDRVRAVVIELHPTLCDADRVRALLDAKFDRISDMSRRTSSKPLLYCRRNNAGTSA